MTTMKTVPDEEVTHVSGNVYELMDVDYRGIFGGAESLINSVYSQADKFAREQGKVASPVAARLHRVGWGLNADEDWGWFYYKFALVDPGTPEAMKNASDFGFVRDNRYAFIFYPNRHQIQDNTKQADIYGEIRKLDELRKDGLLTDEEFEANKKRVLDSQN